jgi:energy-coupling factor transporter ATP-binding protein EcfA2
VAKDTEKKIPPVADRLVWYALDAETPLFVDQNGEAHAFVDGQALPMSRGNRWLTELLYDREGRAPTNEALLNARRVLDMLAHRSGEVRELHTRAAFREGVVFYQLGPGRVIRIDEKGWMLDPDPPVTFRSVKNLRELPDPREGGKLEDLAQWVNLKTKRDLRMYIAYVTLVALAHIPRPILLTTGVMGSGKSTASRVVKRLMDPTSSEAVTIDRRDFLQKASHCFIMMLDNQNALPEWALDTLCRLVTGESDSKRVLYTDDEDLIWAMKRGVILNGINSPSERGDVQDRTLPIELERIDKRNRLPEDDFWMQFTFALPELLGAVFTALSGALRERHTVQLEERPRLADWGLYAAALYESQGWGVKQFVEDWQRVEEAQHQGTLDGSVVAQAIIIFMRDKDRVEKPASKLHTLIEAFVEDDLDLKSDRGWPKTGRTLWKRIREVTPLLESYGIRAGRGTSNKIGRPIVLEKTGDGPCGSKSTARGDDKGDDNCQGDDKGDDIFSASSPKNPQGNAPGDDTGSGGRYSGDPIPSDRKEASIQPESPPNLSSPSSPDGLSKKETPVSFDAQPGEMLSIEELRNRRERRLTEEEARRVQKLIGQGMAPKFARRTVLGGEA